MPAALYPLHHGQTLAGPWSPTCAAWPPTQETDRAMTFSEPLMASLTLLLALCVLGIAIATTFIGWLGAVLFIAGYLAGLITPRSE